MPANILDQASEPETPWMRKRRKRGDRLMQEQMLQNRAHETPKPTPIKLWTHEEFQRDWVLEHVGRFFVAYRDDTLTAFWSSLEKQFWDKFQLSFEAREKVISLAQYLAQTIHEYLCAEALLPHKNIPTDEAAIKIFEHLTLKE
ncbi:hypothetical protein C8J56DRAFT_888520 [Mycena floridula]|nr:hypothetical protein C8J56DRAFT_888520 [Mycena floridula]